MQTPITALSMPMPAWSGELTPMQQQAIGNLFDSLNAQLGAKMADLYAGVPAQTVQSEWAAGLSGFRRSEIERGLSACRTRAFAPTLGEFTRMCRPALDPEFAWLEAGHCLRQRDAGQVGDWTHPAVYRAACVMSMEVRSGDWKAYRKRWEWTLQREIAQGWSEVPEPALRLKSEVKVGPPDENVRERLKELRAAMFAAEDKGTAHTQGSTA